MAIIIDVPGFLTSVQDGGRYGLQQYGVTAAGAADQRSYAYANLLVGNANGEAALEATMLGPTLRFTQDTVFALTGADMDAKLNGRSIPRYQALKAKADSTLVLGYAKAGCRAYIAFAGGIDVPLVMGSRSTFLRGKFGGLEGRKLEKDDRLELGKSSLPENSLCRRHIRPDNFPSDTIELRVIRGPQDAMFSADGMQTFLTGTYTVTNECDRMGVRLDGPQIGYAPGCNGNINSDGIAFGSIQVPPNGKPIIMMAERQTTGGYTKIAAVATADLPLLAQAKPGMKIRFAEIAVEQAQALLRQQAEHMRALQQEFDTPAANGAECWQVMMNGSWYEATIERIE